MENLNLITYNYTSKGNMDDLDLYDTYREVMFNARVNERDDLLCSFEGWKVRRLNAQKLHNEQGV